MSDGDVQGRCLVAGSAQGAVLFSDVGLSFWGGVDPRDGTVIDRHHPLCGRSIAGRVLAIPSGRGSCSGSNVLLELILNGHAPVALVFERDETILPLGVVIAEELFDRSIPVVGLDPTDFRSLDACEHLRVADGTVGPVPQPDAARGAATAVTAEAPALALSDTDRAMLAGRHGAAAAVAMRILVRMAAIAGAATLIDVTQAHIDGCIYTGPASLAVADRFVGWGARVRVPTSLNAISVDRRGWRAQGVAAEIAEPASVLADRYVAMGAAPTFTCAPYLLGTAPSFGEQVGWSESNAVAFANSVLGARTMKLPDILDLCVALTGRAPLTSCQTSEGRRATVQVEVDMPSTIDDAFWPCLGYLVGTLSPDAIPLVTGLEGGRPDRDDLKAFAAAFATTSGAPMFHLAGLTPEAPTAAAALGGVGPGRVLRVANRDLRASWAELNTATEPAVDLVCLGNPHFSLAECRRLATLCRGRTKSPAVAVVVTCGRAIHDEAEREGLVEALAAFGVAFVTDTCWCMLGAPVIPGTARTLMTNSAKYAHYGPGLVGRPMHFASLADCVEAAVTGRAPPGEPTWLREAGHGDGASGVE